VGCALRARWPDHRLQRRAGGGSTARVLVRSVDGAPATDLGPGNAVALSPDGKWAVARQRFMHPPRLVLIPTGAGQPRVVPTGNIEPAERVAFTPDGRNLIIVGNAPGRPQRTFLCELTTGQIRAITPDGVSGMLNDGVSVIARRKFYPFSGGPPKPIPSLRPDERIARFDGKSVWTNTEKAIFRIDLTTGQRETVTDYGSGSRQALFSGAPVLAADGRAYAYTYVTITSDLYLVEGARASMR
jgi:hypothetical protein